MKTTARFVGGPWGGRKLDIGRDYGANQITRVFVKPLTRREQYEMMTASTSYATSDIMLKPRREVRATYRLAIRAHQNGNNINMVPCMHPDGSLFYEYVEGSKVSYDR